MTPPNNPLRDLLPAIAAILIFCSSAEISLAIEAGDYKCHIDSAFSITTEGDKITLENAPGTFHLQAVNAPVTPDELRHPLRSLNNYHPESLPTVSLSIDIELFNSSNKALRSRDGYSYSQDANAIVFTKDHDFFAYGLVDKQALKGISIYTGKCARR